MAVASKKFHKTEQDLKARLNRETGEVEVYAVKEVVDNVEDDDLEISEEGAREINPDAIVGDFVDLPMETAEITDEAGRLFQIPLDKVRKARLDPRI